MSHFHAAIELRRCDVRVGGDIVLPNTDIRVEVGECVALVGPSGSGKTTVLNLIRGDVEPSNGRVVLHGEDLSAMRPRRRASVTRSQVSSVFQDPMLLSELSVLENVILPLLLHGTRRTDAEPIGRDRLVEVGLAARADDGLTGLSGGELQRVAVARALVRDVPVLLADEPTASLDAVNALNIAELLVSAARSRQTTLLVATHDERVAARCDRVEKLRR